jgi:hypothetical protein
MENNILNTLWPFQVCCDALWPYKCTCYPSTFNELYIFYEYLDDFMVCYINHIFNFSKNMEDDEWYVCLVLNKLKEVELYTKLKKCGFH